MEYLRSLEEATRSPLDIAVELKILVFTLDRSNELKVVE